MVKWPLGFNWWKNFARQWTVFFCWHILMLKEVSTINWVESLDATPFIYPHFTDREAESRRERCAWISLATGSDLLDETQMSCNLGNRLMLESTLHLYCVEVLLKPFQFSPGFWISKLSCFTTRIDALGILLLFQSSFPNLAQDTDLRMFTPLFFSAFIMEGWQTEHSNWGLVLELPSVVKSSKNYTNKKDWMEEWPPASTFRGTTFRGS